MVLTMRLAGVQTTDRFLRLSVELAVERCLASLDDPAQVAAKVQYLQVDALAQHTCRIRCDIDPVIDLAMVVKLQGSAGT